MHARFREPVVEAHARALQVGLDPVHDAPRGQQADLLGALVGEIGEPLAVLLAGAPAPARRRTRPGSRLRRARPRDPAPAGSAPRRCGTDAPSARPRRCSSTRAAPASPPWPARAPGCRPARRCDRCRCESDPVGLALTNSTCTRRSPPNGSEPKLEPSWRIVLTCSRTQSSLSVKLRKPGWRGLPTSQERRRILGQHGRDRAGDVHRVRAARADSALGAQGEVRRVVAELGPRGAIDGDLGQLDRRQQACLLAALDGVANQFDQPIANQRCVERGHGLNSPLRAV